MNEFKTIICQECGEHTIVVEIKGASCKKCNSLEIEEFNNEYLRKSKEWFWMKKCDFCKDDGVWVCVDEKRRCEKHYDKWKEEQLAKWKAILIAIFAGKN